ncbi:hypothetical protein FRB94_014022 [Tulasnella sp. JGI-2019a]|nr:hypothetical protein FRB94_014022 [Tulasnella sp. JGI-2019a]
MFDSDPSSVSATSRMSTLSPTSSSSSIDPNLDLSVNDFEGQVISRFLSDLPYLHVSYRPALTLVTGGALSSSERETTLSSGMDDDRIFADVRECSDMGSGEAFGLQVAFYDMTIEGGHSVEDRIDALDGWGMGFTEPRRSQPSFHSPRPRPLASVTARDPVPHRPRKPVHLSPPMSSSPTLPRADEDGWGCSLMVPLRIERSSGESPIRFRRTLHEFRYRCPHCNVGSHRKFNIKRHFKTCIVLKSKPGCDPARPLDMLVHRPHRLLRR